MALGSYWAAIDAAKVILAKAASVDDVMAVCGSEPGVSVGDGWWGGDGDELLDVLFAAGWSSVTIKAGYYWCLRAPDGSLLSYVEGDLYRGNTLIRGGS